VPIHVKKKIYPSPIRPMTAVYPAYKARDAPIASIKEDEV